MVEDDDIGSSEVSTPTKATSVESDVAQLHGSYLRGQLPTHTCLKAQPLTDPSSTPCLIDDPSRSSKSDAQRANTPAEGRENILTHQSASEERGGQDTRVRAEGENKAEEDRGTADLWEDKGPCADDEGEGSHENGNKKKALVRSTEKWSLSPVKENSPLKRRCKHGRFWSTLSFKASFSLFKD